jgi:hypothetical protein
MLHENEDWAYSPEAVVAHLTKMGSSPNSPTIVVEGADGRFWRRYKSREVNIIPANGKKAVREGIRVAIEEMPELIGSKVGIYDEDYEQLYAAEPFEHPNLFSTKKISDLESLLTGAWMKSSQPMIIRDKIPITKDLVREVVRICRSIGVLRALNMSESLGLKFKEGDNPRKIQSWLKQYVESQKKEKGLGEKVLIDCIVNNSKVKSKKKLKESIHDFYRSEVNNFRELDDYSLTNGHDICKVLELLTVGAVSSSDIERYLLFDFDVIDCKDEFGIFNRLDEWSSKNKVNLLRWN